ncbi:MAG: NUDIX domain-containing protein [Halorhodospira halophila]|uniref:NUDIX domain-containing protein n=1 Tax=Halorhodospira TaxID=85108 RepID=UPI001911C592|nr:MULTISPECIES: NUDIX domain-containing protein [Halorhodospira]MBK5936897.1 ADP-ribose diphosphatase [Halorhodospira halophila]MBK5942342.1 ADP-ribose diphosphatase [Halorhodospira halophila]MCC3750317.1 NUDIX domain-containing protein [Halorhodospira halophila]MCG5528124.1 NUDIX domain-containing protein [Halorhodospira halophila]MCG5531893.1 NUDIX domain-containing protein [Halorhodospira sp. 9621]
MAHRFEILGRDPCHEGFLRLDRIRLRHARFEGGMTPELTRECLVRGLAVGVLPYDPERDEVILVEQFRVGAIDDNRGAWITETIAGIAEPGEDPRTVAIREAREEANVVIEDLRPIADYLPSPGGSTERVVLYCARCDTSEAGGVHGLDEEHEDIWTHVLPADEAIGQVAEGHYRAAMPVIALQWLALNRRRLREEWTEGAWSDHLWSAEDPD